MKSGLEVVRIRKQANLTQGELASELRWNVESIVDIERERIGIDDRTFEIIMAGVQRAGDRKREEVIPA